MEIDDQLHSLFSGRVEKRDGSYIIEVPAQELDLGSINKNSSYRVAVLARSTEAKEETEHDPQQETRSLEPPVERGETRTVEVESIGDQGDGICRVERGYIVIVPDTEKGERVRIEVTQVQENVAFANVVERLDYYE